MSLKNVNRPGYKRTEVGWIPNEWEYSPLSGVAEVIVSNVDKKTNHGELPIQLCNYTDVYYNPYIVADMGFMKASATENEIEKFALKKNDVIITKDSETPDDIAVPSLVVEEIPGVICGYHLAILRPNEHRLVGGFLGALLRLQTMRHYFFTLANGVTRFGLSIDAISNAHLPLPPLSEQRKIAEILSTWDRAIAQTRRLLDACKRRKQGLMQKLLTGTWRFPEFGKPAENGKLPDGWIKKSAEDVFENISKKKCGHLPVLSVTQDEGVVLRDSLDRKINMSDSNTGGYKVVESGDFVISLRSFQGGLEYSAVRGIVSPAYLVIRPIIEIDSHFFKYHFKSYEFIGRLASTVIGIRDGKQISFEDFQFLIFPFPPLPEQEKIASILAAADKEITTLQKSLDKLQQQKRGLMQKLLTGEIRV